jgi:hypothetical protein
VLVFIDDSGDAGFKLTQGSTRSLVIACCVFPTNDAAERASAEFRILKESLGMSERQEFKFAKTSRDRRAQFARLAAKQDFFVRAIRFDKERVFSEHLRSSPEHFYNYAIRQVLSKSGQHVRDARVRLDGSGGREYKKALYSYLRKQANVEIPGTVQSVKLIDSHRDLLIQLADMVAGAVRHSFDKDGAIGSECFDILRPVFRDRRSSLWNFR